MARRSEHSREELHRMTLDATEEIVRTQGFHQLSARKIAQQIGYTVGTLYHVFENIDDIILQVNSRTLDRLHAHLVEAARGTQDPEQRLLALGSAYVGFAVENPHRWEMVFGHRMQNAADVPAWYRNQVTRMFEPVETVVTELLGGSPALQAGQYARAVWSGVHGICILALPGKLDVTGAESAQALTRKLIRCFVAGLQQEGREA